MRKNGINLRKFCCTIKQNRKGRIGIDREIDEFTTRERVISFIFFCVCCFILFPFNSSSTPRSFHQHNDLMLECTFSLFSFKRSPILTRFSISNAFSISLSVFTLRCSCFKVLHFGKIVHLFFSSLC